MCRRVGLLPSNLCLLPKLMWLLRLLLRLLVLRWLLILLLIRSRLLVLRLLVLSGLSRSGLSVLRLWLLWLELSWRRGGVSGVPWSAARSLSRHARVTPVRIVHLETARHVCAKSGQKRHQKTP